MKSKYLFLGILIFSYLILVGCMAKANLRKQDSDSIQSNGSASLSDKTVSVFSYPLTPDEEAFLDSLEYKTFLYFKHEINPENGLVRDRSTDDSPCSIAAVGFGFGVWAVGAERGWISRRQAIDWTLAALRFFWQSNQSIEPIATGYKGFYYHFLTMDSGERMWNCELSTVDTAWLLAGIRFSAQYYFQDEPGEREIRALADSLTYRVDWNWTALPDSGRYANTISLGWRPEKGFIPVGWIGYNEALMVYILAAGSGYRDIDRAYRGWLSSYDWRQPYPELALLSFPPLFGHQYTHMFIDLKGLADRYMQEKGIDYFENSRRAVLVQQRYAKDNPMGWAGYDSLTWGLTACDGPGSDYNSGDREFGYYRARGTSGLDLIQGDDGTIAPTAAAASIVFAPEIVIPTLQTMLERYGDKGLWGPYGYYDAFNPTLNWYNSDYLGIDQGPIVLMIENFRTGLIWKYTKRDPVIQKGLEVLGFQKVKSE